MDPEGARAALLRRAAAPRARDAQLLPGARGFPRVKLVDLSHPLEDGMQAYPGLPPPRIGAHLDHATSREKYQHQAEFYLGKVEMVGNVGTYIDAPFHRYPDGVDLAGLPLERIADVPGVVLDAKAGADRAIALADPGDLRGKAVLVRTGWSRRWGTPAYWELGPFLSGASVETLVRAGVALVGVDFWNVDDTTDPARPAHTRLLGAGIPIVEHLRALEALPRDGFRFTAVPPPLVRGASFPVRAFAAVP